MQVIVVQMFKSNKMGNGNMLPVTFLLPPKKTKNGLSKAGEGERKAFEGDSNVTDLTWASARKDDALRSYCYERLGTMNKHLGQNDFADATPNDDGNWRASDTSWVANTITMTFLPVLNGACAMSSLLLSDVTIKSHNCGD